jgi:outer membrane protein TolC
MRRFTSFVLAALAALAWMPAPAGAQLVGDDVVPPDTLLARKLLETPGQALLLQDAIDLAFQNGTDARLAEAIAATARGELRREKGVFDPELFADAERRNDTTRPTSPFEGVDKLELDTRTLLTGVRTTLPFGTELEAALETAKSSTNATFATVNPQYDTEGVLSVRQPLLRGLGPGTRENLSAAERGLESAEATRIELLLGLRADVEIAYWDLYAAWRTHAVQLLLVERARSVIDEAQAQVGMGLVGPNAIENARVFAAQQELAALDTEEQMDAISDRLASLLGVRPTTAVRYRPVDTPPQDLAVENEAEVVAEAMRVNPAIRASERAWAVQLELARGAHWNALPGLDLTGQLGGTGLAGTGRDVELNGVVFPSSIDGDFSDTMDQVFGGDFPLWAVGLELSYPIGRREGLGERDRLRAVAAQFEHQLDAQRRALEEVVRARAREVNHGARRLAIAQEGVAAAAELVRIGIIEYRSGRTTAFELVRLASDYASAQDQLSRALVRTAKADAALRELTAAEVPQ